MHTNERGKHTPAQSRIAKGMRAIGKPGSALRHYWEGSIGESVRHKGEKDTATKNKKMPIIERGQKQYFHRGVVKGTRRRKKLEKLGVLKERQI